MTPKRRREGISLTPSLRDGVMSNVKEERLASLLSTPLQRRTQVRFWIQFKIPTEYDKLMPRLPENAKIKIPQVGTYFTL